MVVRDVAREEHELSSTGRSAPGDRAYVRAWWSLALYPLSFVAAFIIGEGILAMLADDPAQAPVWQVLTAATPALVVFAVPGALAVVHGRRAMRSGRKDGKVPAVVGATIGLGFVALNLVAYVVGLVMR
jgi:hypothetical protein